MALALAHYVGKRTLARLSRRFLSRLDEAEVNEDDDCLICQGPPSDPACLPCMHVFCSSCLNEYVHKRQMSPQDFIVQHLLNICIIACPTCRTPIHKKASSDLAFPKPKTCEDCRNRIKRFYLFPNCGHVNEKRCIYCMESYEGEGMVRCPRCLSPCDKGFLEDAFLCSTCEKFSNDRVCKPCLGNLVSPNRTPQETREYAKSEFFSTIAAILVIAVLFFLAIANSSPRTPPPKLDREQYHRPRRKIWYVDRQGRVLESLPKTFTSYSHNRQNQKKFDSEQQKKEKAVIPEKVERKREAVYQKDCYPARVWEVSLDEVVETKKCEEVFVGYRYV